MSDDLRTRIAKVIWKVFENTPPIDATDDEWESWWNDSTDADIRLIGEEKALFYAQADAVICELEADRDELVKEAIRDLQEKYILVPKSQTLAEMSPPRLRDQIAATLAHEWGPSMTWTEVAELAIREVARYRESVSEDEFLDSIIEDEFLDGEPE